jgi:hypothetical protein
VVHNETPSTNHWLIAKLLGTKSNRDGIGAAITLRTKSGVQYQTVMTAGSYCSSSDVRAHFGLGADAEANDIEVRWPSGIIQRLDNVKADQIVTIREAP